MNIELEIKKGDIVSNQIAMCDNVTAFDNQNEGGNIVIKNIDNQ